jgi:hypothetical protein
MVLVMMAEGIRVLPNHLSIWIEFTHHASAIFVEEGEGKRSSIFGGEIRGSQRVNCKVSIGKNSGMTPNSAWEFPGVNFLSIDVNQVSCVAGQRAEECVAPEGPYFVNPRKANTTSFQRILLHVESFMYERRAGNK